MLKICLLLGRKVMTNLDSILKIRGIICNKSPSSQGYGFSSRRIDAFELCYWRRPLRAPWTARRSNQSILKEISPRGSLKGLRLKLKLQYIGHLIQRNNSFEKTLILGKNEGGRRRGWWDGWMASLTPWTWVWVKSWSWWWTGRPGMLQSMGSQRVRCDWETEITESIQGNLPLWK